MRVDHLWNATADGEYDLVERLLDEGAELLATDVRGRTCFQVACERGHDKVFKALLGQLKKDLTAGRVSREQVEDIITGKASTLLSTAADLGHVGCVDALVGNGMAEVSGAAANQACLKAAGRGHVIICEKLLVKCGALMRFNDSVFAEMGTTPIHVAIEQNKISVVRLFLKHQNILSVNEVNGVGASPLITATAYGREEMVKLLCLEPTVNINVNADGLGTALYCVCSSGISINIVSTLLEVDDIDVNLEEKQTGNTPLIAAARSGNIEAINLLLEHKTQGIDNAKFVDTEDAVEDEELVQLGSGEEDLDTLTGAGTRTNINKQSYDGESAAMAAAVRGHTECLKALLSHPELDVNLENVFGSTALSLATRKGHVDCVRLLADCPTLIWAKQGRAVTHPSTTASAEIRDILKGASAGKLSGSTQEAGCDVFLSPIRMLFSPG